MPVEPIPCVAPEPESPVPPCCSPGLASTGLCLADGTPIAVLAVTACADCGTAAAAPEQSGWLNLLTGQYTAGPPPAGAEACAGQPQQFQVGQWCDLDDQDEVIAPVLVEYEYDDNGALVGVRTLTPDGDPYTVTGTLGICPGPVDDVEYLVLCDVAANGTTVQFLRALTPNGDGTSTARDTTLDGSAPYVPAGTVGLCGPEHVLDPVQFCFSSTATVERPGRVYEVDLPVAQGFGLEAVLVDLVEYPAPVIWGVSDVDGSQFAADLRAATQARFPGATVTVTPPAITATCGAPEMFHVRIECLDLEEQPPALVQYRYNGGQDLISNPSFATTPPTANVSVQLRRTDAGGKLNCTDTANRGWETNDRNQSFEYWGYANTPPGPSAINASKATTPTPRATPVLEINAYGSEGGGPSTIWQTFQVDTAGAFNIRVVIGARTAPVEPVAIKLSTGDVDANGTGDIISTVVNAPRVTNEGGGPPGQWTTYTNTVPLTPGLYTLAFTGPPNPPSPTATGGLFTDMRVYQDVPGQLVNFATDDDTCAVSVDVTSTTCELWVPLVDGGEITRWQRLTDRLLLDNAAFWTQVPAPSCCSSDTPGDNPGGVGNLADSYPVCALVGGEAVTVQRVVITDQSGGILSEQFIGTDGAALTPQSWTPGECPEPPCLDCTPQVLCDTDPNPPATIAGTASSGTLANGVAWTSTGPSPLPPTTSGDGAAWWGVAVFPNPSIPTNRWDFDQPVTVEFSVLMNWSTGTGATENAVQIPVGAVPVSVPPGYTYDPGTRILHVDDTLTACILNNPARSAGARFRMTGVTSLSLHYLGTRTVNRECRTFGTWLFGALDVFLGGEFVRTECRDCTGAVVSRTDTTLDGEPYTPVGMVGVCQPPEPCPSTVQVLRLCDLNPTAKLDEDGKRCAVPFLRHLVYDCTGALVTTRDTAVDGITPYTPVQAVECAAGVPALSELLWPQSGIAEDPAGAARQDFIYTITNPENGDVAEVRLHASSTAPGGCGAYDPAAPVFNNPTTYTLTLDTAAQAMSVFRLDLLDFDTFEGITGLTPVPSRVEGDVTWSGSTINANTSNQTVYVYWDTVPETITYRYGNTGGGLAGTSVAFQGMTLVPEGCCGCDAGEPCRDTSSTLLCDTTTTESVTVFDPAGVTGPGGWQVVSFTGNQPGYGPTGAMPYDVYQGTSNTGQTSYGARPDLNAGPAAIPWPGYDNAPVRWIIRKTFDAPEDGTATVTATGFRADGGGRVRINGTDMGLYSQWGQPGVGGGGQAPVTAGPNTIEIEVRDDWGFNWVTGRLDIVMTKTVEFLRRTVVDCETGETVSITDTTLDGQPYVVTGEVGTCTPVQECCPQENTETQALCDTAQDGTVTAFLRHYTHFDGGVISAVVDTLLDGATTYTPTGAVGVCGADNDGQDVEVIQLCDKAPGAASVPFLRHLVYTAGTVPPVVVDTLLDGTTPYVPVGEPGDCGEQCRDTSSTLLCDTSATDLITVFDPANRPDADGWEVVSFTGFNPDGPPEAPMPYPARYGMVYGYPALGARTDQNAGFGGGTWPGYDAAPVRWVLRKQFTAPEDGVAVAQSVGFRGDGGARVRINGVDAGMYGQWNQPATSGTAQIPVTAGLNTVEIEVRDTNGINNVVGRLNIALPKTVQFMRRQTVDCDTGEVIATHDTTLDGEPYTVTGEVGQCEPVAECCEQPPPEQRVDVETQLLCVLDASGEALSRVLAEIVYDDQTGDRIGQRLVDPATWQVTDVPPGATLGQCPAADGGCRDATTLLLCDVPPNGAPAAVVADTDPAPYYPGPTAAPVAGAQALWDGGNLDLPPGTSPQPGTVGSVNSLAATITAPRPVCDAGTARVTVSVAVQQTGPDDGCGPTGHLRLFNGTTQTALTVLPPGTAAGWSAALTVEANVPAADLAAGRIAVAVALDAYDDSPTVCTPSPRRTGWMLSAFTAAVEYDQAGCATQFLRTVTVDCATGAVLAVADTTLDGGPYTVAGQPGQCQPAAPGPGDECAQHLREECRWDDTDGDGVGDVRYVELLSVDGCTGALTPLRTYTPGLSGPYTPVAPVADGPVAPAPAARGVQAHRLVLTSGASWDASTVPLLQAVTLVARGTATVTTADGPSDLVAGESIGWSVARDSDAALTGPLTVTAGDAPVAVAWTAGVTL